MRLYHYVAKGNTVLTDGILSFAQNPHADLSYYYKRSGETTYVSGWNGVLKEEVVLSELFLSQYNTLKKVLICLSRLLKMPICSQLM
mgnify:CR=1 FL=1